MYDENASSFDLVINLDMVAKWLAIKKSVLIKTLKHSYKESVDYKIKKTANPNKILPRNNNYKLVMITPDCFKRLCMQSRSKKAEEMRSYFIDIETILFKYRNDIIHGLQQRIRDLENNQK